MKIIKTTAWFPPDPYDAIALGPWIFTKLDHLSESVVRHESIHWEQQKETLILGFLILYVLFFVIELVLCFFDKSRNASKNKRSLWERAYWGNLFEKEAYANEREPGYLERRPFWAWIKA